MIDRVVDNATKIYDNRYSRLGNLVSGDFFSSSDGALRVCLLGRAIHISFSCLIDDVMLSKFHKIAAKSQKVDKKKNHVYRPVFSRVY